jgi:hypothetical protein
MKRFNFLSTLIIFGISISLFSSCNQTPSAANRSKAINNELPNKFSNTDGIPKINFRENEHDFGNIVAGEKITHAFKFTNTGDADLLIVNVSTSCGCTVSEFPKEPIKPGKSGVIKLTFDSRGREGYQNKTATIETNTEPNKVFLRLKATVKKS